MGDFCWLNMGLGRMRWMCSLKVEEFVKFIERLAV